MSANQLENFFNANSLWKDGEKETIVILLKEMIRQIKNKPLFAGYIETKTTAIITLSSILYTVLNYREITTQIPFIKFDPDWEVRMVPPFCGAMCRFHVRKINGKGALSVYLDCHDVLGWMQRPYWEVYPVQGDTRRVYMDDVDGLLAAIREGLEHPEEDNKSETQDD